MLLLLLAPKVKKGLHASIKNIVDVHWTCVSRKKAGRGGGGGKEKVSPLVSETSLEANAAKPDKNGKSMERSRDRVERKRIKKSLGMYGWVEGCELGLGDDVGPQQFTTFHFRSASRKVFLNNIHK